MAKRTEVRDREWWENRVLSICQAVEDVLGMGWWDVRQRFNTDPGDDQATTCETDTIWKYRYAHMTWNLNSITGCTDQQIMEIAVHEYVHVMMGPLKNHILPDEDYVTDLEEFVTETIARSIYGLLELT